MEKERCEVDKCYKWDLEKIYKTVEDIDKDKQKVEDSVTSLLNYKGHLCDSSDNLYNALKLYFEIERTLDKLIVYSNMKLHEDMSLSSSRTIASKYDKFLDEVSSQISFFSVELLKNDESLIKKYIKEDERLKEYEFSIEQVFRDKPYILNEEQEKMMANLGEVLNTPTEIYETLDTTSLSFDDFYINNEKYSLNQSNYTLYLRDDNREIRKKAFLNYYKEYKKMKDTLSSVLYGNIKANFFISKQRGYKSPLEMYLYAENIPTSLYEKLIKEVSNRIDVSYKYIALRKKVLNLDEMHMYDIYVPLVKYDKKYTYEEALDIVKEALKPLGDTYIKDLNNIISSSCIDVYHNKNKQTGAYSWGCYDTLPYVLLNFEGTFNDVSTLAHELGHSMHSYYSKINNPYQDASYTIFLAEVASTVNEILLNKYMYKNAKTKNEKLYFLNNLLEMLRTTLIRQTMFAEFEKTLYDMENNGTILTCDVICKLYYTLNKKYYGNDIVHDTDISLEWARISHFYKGFYVYKYATGISIACKIAKDILDEKEGALDNYLKLLQSGGSNYSTFLLKIVGIDIVNDDTIKNAIDLFDDVIDEFYKNL